MTVTGPDGSETEMKIDIENWETSTIELPKKGEWKISIKDGDDYHLATEITVTVKQSVTMGRVPFENTWKRITI